MRLGLRYVRGLRQQAGEAIAGARAARGFASVEDLKRRCALRGDEMEALAEAGALASLGLTRRAALWQTAWVARQAGPLFAENSDQKKRREIVESPLPEMTPFEETLADFARTEVTVGPHPVSYVRQQLARKDVVPAAIVSSFRHGTRLRTAGSVIVRQRPGTAKGTVFITLEDETGMIQAVIEPELWRKERSTVVGSAGLVVEGRVTQRDGSVSIRAEKFWPLAKIAEIASHDFH